MRENAMGLTVVLADGRIIRTGGRVRKSSTGYDLTRLFVGSEGTLGVITEIQLRLHGIPEAMSSATCQFPTLRDAVETVIAIMQTGIPVADGTAGRGADGSLHRLLEPDRSGASAYAVL
jgi:D-lactate dehydrogenase (cytochrome)